MRMLEQICLNLDRAPWGGVLRLLVGTIILPIHSFFCRDACPPWTVFLFFLSVLVMLRAGPLVVRKLLPFSKQAQEIWLERRRLAKVYDSYQWQKLFWIGLGMGSSFFYLS